jgi:hypothetical protein
VDSQRVIDELALLRTRYPELEFIESEGYWVRLLNFHVPPGWSHSVVEVAFQIPAEAAVAPYAFNVRPALTLADGGQPSNYTSPSVTPWGADFAKFSWSPLEPWVPRAEIGKGANMLNFVSSFTYRLAEAS